MNGKVEVNEMAPDFNLPSQSGTSIKLSDFLGKKWIVLYFYPKDDSLGCRAESCAFRDSYEVFKEAGAEVIGVSSDGIDSHAQFSSKHRLPFILLSDVGGIVRKQYGVPTTLGMLPGRVTYVIDKKGMVRHIFSSQFKPREHVDESLRIIKEGKANKELLCPKFI